MIRTSWHACCPSGRRYWVRSTAPLRARYPFMSKRRRLLTRPETAVYDDLGILLLLSGKTGLAEKALHTAHSLCLRTHNTDYLPNIQEHLAELNLAQKNYPAALRLIDAAFASHSPLFQINPQYYPIHVRAQILLGLGRRDAALNEFRHAVEEAD